MNAAAKPGSAADWCDRAIRYWRKYVGTRENWVRAWEEPQLSHEEYLTAFRDAMDRKSGWLRRSKLLLLIHARPWAAAYYRLNTTVHAPRLNDAEESSPALMLVNTITARAADAAEACLRAEGFTATPHGLADLDRQHKHARLQEAMRLYGARGATWSEIAEVVGVSRATLYRMLGERRA